MGGDVNHHGMVQGQRCETIGVDLVKDDQGKVRSIPDKIQYAQSRQKKYVDHKTRDMPFQTVRIFFLGIIHKKGNEI